jgi:hypothetical protein
VSAASWPELRQRIKDAAGYARVRRRVAEGVETLAQGLNAGALTPDAWQREMAELLLAGHLAAAQEGNGGRALSPEQQQEVLGIVAEQVDRLNLFADAVDADGWADSMLRRALMYVDALGASEQAGRTGRLPLPAYPRDGSTPCLTNCDCSWRVVWKDRAKGDADAFWRLGAVEDHCDECKARARRWAPLRFRGWEAQ